ncbi:hypothetical protein PspLS_03462 [Pyricularia sp. CBS 133598]|nr:hypothetical protein PspLS_03462 [Pyricularia sp. CBS 133598]
MRSSNLFTAAILTLAFNLGNAAARPSGPPSPIAGSPGAAAKPTSPQNDEKLEYPVCAVQLIEGDTLLRVITTWPGQRHEFEYGTLSGAYITADDCTITD